MKLAIGLICLGVTLPLGASAAGGPVPLQEEICVNGVVDKNKLATFLFDHNGVTRTFEDAQATLHPPRAGLGSRARMIADERLCTLANPCSKDDASAFNGAIISLENLLTLQGQAYRNEKGVTSVSRYLTDASAQLDCVEVSGKPVEAAGAVREPRAKPLLTHLRVRASGDDVAVDANDDAFKNLPKATVSIDHDLSKETAKIVGAIAYPLFFETKGNSTYALIPYAGLNWSSVQTVGKGTAVDPQTYDFGLSMDLRQVGLYAAPGAAFPFAITNWLTARPDVLFDRGDGSSLLSLNTKYTPVINSVLNSYLPVIPSYLSMSLLLDARFDAGWYINPGTSAGNVDYSRLGGRAGVSLTSDYAGLPLDLTLSETYLKTLYGPTTDVRLFSAVLSVSIDPTRNLGLDLSYNKGTREDTDKPVDSWKIALGAKY